MSVSSAALIAVITYLVVAYLDMYILGWQTLTRPICLAPFVGLALGNFHTGILMGASLEAIFMGISAIGGSVPADTASGSIVPTVFVIVTGASIETGIAMAMPIGVVMNSIRGLWNPLLSYLAPYWENLAIKGKPRSFEIQVRIFAAVPIIIPCILMYIAMTLGVTGLNNLLNSMPKFVMTGLTAASGMLVGVGYGVLTSMIWNGQIGAFFFVGFVMAKVLNMSTLAIAIIGACIAVVMFFQDKKFIDLKNSVKGGESKSEEAFF